MEQTAKNAELGKPEIIKVVGEVISEAGLKISGVSRDWPFHQLAVKIRFSHVTFSEIFYIHKLPGFVDPNKSGYHSKADSSLFVFHRGSDIAYLLLYVDDIILTTSSSAFLQRIIASLHSEFSMTDLGSLNYFLGISAQRSASGLFLSQSKFAKEIIEQDHMQNYNPILLRNPGTYSLLYQQVCLYMHDPRDPHFTALKRILRYVRGAPLKINTLDWRRVWERSRPIWSSPIRSPLGIGAGLGSGLLIGFGDGGWPPRPKPTPLPFLMSHLLLSLLFILMHVWGLVSCTRRSTSGYWVFLGDNLLSWSGKRQVTLSRSSAEAEYRGVANVVAETAWIRNLLRALYTPLFTATLVYCDNVSAVYMSANPVQHHRTKHIKIDIHFVHDFVASGQVRVLHVPSRFQYADIFTKGLPTALFFEFRTKMFEDLSLTLRGSIRLAPQVVFRCVVILGVLQLIKKRYGNYVWTVSSRRKLEKIIDIHIHPRSTPVAITVYRDNDIWNFEYHKEFKFGEPSLSEWDELGTLRINESLPYHEQDPSLPSKRKRKAMELEPETYIDGLNCNRTLPEGVTFVNNKVTEEPKHGLFFIDVFGDSSFQRVGDIEKVETEILLGYKMMALSVKTPENQRFIVLMNRMIDERPDKNKLTSKKVKLEALGYSDV
ncbi:ribonuclease H-like domain-containing protein [Tanacetum coccineum]